MNRRVLLVNDNINPICLKEAAKPENGSASFSFLMLGLSYELILFLRGKDISKIKNIEAVDVKELAEISTQNIREFIPKFIFEFPQKRYFLNNKSLLDCLRKGGLNFWWFNKMSEKGALHSTLVKRLYNLDLIRRALAKRDYDEIWAETSDKKLISLLKSNENRLCPVKEVGHNKPVKKTGFWTALFINTFVLHLSSIIKSIVIRQKTRRKGQDTQRKTALFFTFFPLFWNKALTAESFFRSFPEKISHEFDPKYAAWISGGIRQTWRSRKFYQKQSEDKGIVFLEKKLSFADHVRIFFSTLVYFIKAARIKLVAGSYVKETYRGLNITNIVIDELELGLSSPSNITSLMIFESLNKYLKKAPVSSVLFRAEFQPHEKAISCAARNDALTIAFQHQAIGRNFLQYFFAPGEIARYSSERDDPDSMPIASKYAVSGQYPRDTLCGGGFSENDVKICGPVRYSGLVRYLRKKEDKPKIRKKYGYGVDRHIFLVTPPAAKNEVLNFALTLAKAADGLSDKYLFLFKSHPVFKFDKEITDIINKLSPSLKYEFLDDDVDLNEYIVLSDALILAGTTVGIEAICLGTMPILISNPAVFSLNPLTEIEDACLKAGGSEELKKAIDLVVGGAKDLEKIKGNWPEAVRKLFYDIESDPEERFFSLIKEWTK